MGSVTLVGAGCGNDLITVKGLKAVRSADVIVYDDLIDKNLLNYAGDGAELIYAGKRLGHHSEKQENINKILIKAAGENKRVVRLKGGDSFVFGRGGEEILALQRAGTEYDIIPGVTSAVAVLEDMGIPVTHRGTAQSFTVVTGHTASDTDENYEALAKLCGTLVFLMGLHNIENICKRLMDNGKDKATPACILSKGFDKNQKRIDGTLETIADKSRLAETPAILVVGRTAEFNLRRTRALPLDGVSVTVTGTKEFAFSLSEKLNDMGADVSVCPYLNIIPEYHDIPDSFSEYTYLVFTSGNGIKVFFDYLREKKIDFRAISHLKFACIGASSAKKLAKYGFNADFIPGRYTAESLGKELAEIVSKDDRLLLLRASDGSDDLTNQLDRARIKYDDVKIYDTKAEEKCINCDTDYITFASAGGVSAFFKNGGVLNHTIPVCIGEITAKEFEKHSRVTPLIAKKHTAEGIISLILEDINETL